MTISSIQFLELPNEVLGIIVNNIMYTENDRDAVSFAKVSKQFHGMMKKNLFQREEALLRNKVIEIHKHTEESKPKEESSMPLSGGAIENLIYSIRGLASTSKFQRNMKLWEINKQLLMSKIVAIKERIKILTKLNSCE